MGRKIKNPIEVRAVVHWGIDGNHVDHALIRYTLSCEHEVEERKELQLLPNQEVENFVKDFVEEGLRQVDIIEGVEEEESLIEYPKE